MDQAHSQRATVALRKLAEFDPAFSSLSLWCKHRDAQKVDALEIETNETTGEIGEIRAVKVDWAPAYTDGQTIWYGEKFASWTLKQQMAVCAHEIMHVSFRHINRARKMRERLGEAFDPRLMNIATDAIINQTLLLAKYDLPRPCIILTELFKEVFDEEITAEDGLASYDAEKLYMKLINDQKSKGGGKGQPQQGQGGGAGDQGEGQGQGQGQSPADKAKTYADSKGFKDDMDGSGKSTPEDVQEDSEWQQRLARAMQAGKMAGKGIGKIGHMIADLPKSRTPWEVILRRLVTKAVTRTPRQSYERPTRRWLGMEADARMRGVPVPAYEPGMIKQSDRPRIVVGVDVSGSISDPILNIFCGEIAAIGNKTGAEIHVIVFDDGIISEHKLDGVDFKDEIKKIQFARGGGTSFVDVINRAKEIDPSIIVILTDLYGPFGQSPAQIPVIWASPEDAPPTPPFGRLLSLAA